MKKTGRYYIGTKWRLASIASAILLTLSPIAEAAKGGNGGGGGGGGGDLIAPTALQANPLSACQVDLNWDDPNSSEDGYRIERSLDGVNFATVTETVADVTSYSDQIEAGTVITYRIFAFTKKAKGPNITYTLSDASNLAQATKLAINKTPTGFFSYPKSGTEVELGWEYQGTPSDVEVQRRAGYLAHDPFAWQTIATVPAGTKRFTDTGVGQKANYIYRVVSKSACKTSAPSNQVMIRTAPNDVRKFLEVLPPKGVVGESYGAQLQTYFNQTASYNIVGNTPAGVTVSPNGVVSWIPSSADVGNHTFSIEITQLGGTILKEWNVNISQGSLLSSKSITAANGGFIAATIPTDSGTATMTLTIPPGALKADDVVYIESIPQNLIEQDQYTKNSAFLTKGINPFSSLIIRTGNISNAEFVTPLSWQIDIPENDVDPNNKFWVNQKIFNLGIHPDTQDIAPMPTWSNQDFTSSLNGGNFSLSADMQRTGQVYLANSPAGTSAPHAGAPFDFVYELEHNPVLKCMFKNFDSVMDNVQIQNVNSYELGVQCGNINARACYKSIPNAAGGYENIIFLPNDQPFNITNLLHEIYHAIEGNGGPVNNGTPQDLFDSEYRAKIFEKLFAESIMGNLDPASILELSHGMLELLKAYNEGTLVQQIVDEYLNGDDSDLDLSDEKLKELENEVLERLGATAFHGKVVDDEGAILPGAEITMSLPLNSNPLKLPRNRTSKGDGTYSYHVCEDNVDLSIAEFRGEKPGLLPDTQTVDPVQLNQRNDVPDLVLSEDDDNLCDTNPVYHQSIWDLFDDYPGFSSEHAAIHTSNDPGDWKIGLVDPVEVPTKTLTKPSHSHGYWRVVQEISFDTKCYSTGPSPSDIYCTPKTQSDLFQYVVAEGRVSASGSLLSMPATMTFQRISVNALPAGQGVKQMGQRSYIQFSCKRDWTLDDGYWSLQGLP